MTDPHRLRPRDFATSLRASLKATFSPATAQLLQEAVSPEPDFSVMATIVRLDPALASAVLSLVNSPFYGQSGKVADIQRAAVILGNNELLRIALSLSLQKNLNAILIKNGFDTFANWRVIIWAALAAELVAERLVPRDKETAYICALVKDLSLLLYAATFPDQVLPRLHNPDFISTADNVAQRMDLPADHSELTAELLTEWRFPEHMVQAISAHHDLNSIFEHPPLTQAVILGTRWAEVEFRAEPSPDSLGQLNFLLSRLGALPDDGLNGLRQRCASRFAHLCAAMNIHEAPPEERLYTHSLQSIQDFHYQTMELEGLTGGSSAIAAGIARHLRWNWHCARAVIVLKAAAGTHWERFALDEGCLSDPVRAARAEDLDDSGGIVFPLVGSDTPIGKLRILDGRKTPALKAEIALYARLLGRALWRQTSTVAQLEIKAGLLDILPTGVALTTPDGRIVKANPMFAEYLGAPGNPQGQPLLALLEHHDFQSARTDWQRFLALPDAPSHCSVHCPLGPAVDALARCFAMSCYRITADGQPALLVLLQNLNELRVLEFEALHQRDFLSRLLSSMQDLVMSIDASGRIGFATGRHAAYLTGRNLFTITRPISIQAEPWNMDILEQHQQAVEVAISLPDGQLQLELVFSRFAHGDDFGLVVGRNISVIRRLERKIKEQALFDALTLVFNRHHLQPLLEREISRARRTSAPLGMIFFDIDKFKVYNDTLGHHNGDKLLHDLGAILRGALRKGLDYPCRFGGDEFVVVSSNATSTGLTTMCQRIQQEFAALHNGSVTLSLGMSLLEPADTPQSLLERCDKANYQAKAQGGNTIVHLQSNPHP